LRKGLKFYGFEKKVIGAALVVFAVVAVSAFSEGKTDEGGYSVTFMGELRPNGATTSHGMNRCGQVVGESGGVDGANEKAFAWKEGGQIEALPGLPGGDYGQAFGVNDGGWIVGSSNTVTELRAVLWTPDGKAKDMGALPGDSESQALGINDRNEVVGFSSGPHGVRAFIWRKKEGMKELAGLPGSTYTEAFAINDGGDVVGESGSTTATHAVLWLHGKTIEDLGVLPGDQTSRAAAINNRGQVVGYARGPHGNRGFIWSKSEGMQDLGLLPGGLESEGLAINDNGVVVGTAGDAGGFRAFLWTREGGIKDLNEMLPADREVTLVGAFAINDRGQIATYGGPLHAHVHHFNAPRAYLLTPQGASAIREGSVCKPPMGTSGGAERSMEGE